MKPIQTSYVALLALALALPARALPPVGSAFTYQGALSQDGFQQATDYDLRFSLWDAETDGNQIGPMLEFPALSGGLFTVELDFGVGVFDGTARWLRVDVREVGDSFYTILNPRQPITPAPYALHALNAGQWQNSGTAIMNTNSGFVGINRDYTVGLEWFGVHAPVNSGYGGMYVTTEGATAWPFYGYRAGTQTAWTYLDGGTGDWHLNVDGNKLTVTDEGNVGIGTSSPAHRLHVVTNAAAGRAVFGSHTASSGTTYGGYFSSASTGGSGIAGFSPNIGAEGQASGASGIGVFGVGPSRGVFGNSTGTSSMAGEFIASGSNSRGVYGAANSGNFSYGVYGEILDASSAGIGVYGKAPSYGVTGEATSGGVGVIGRAPTGIGVYGESGVANGTGVMGANTAASGTTYGVQGIANSPAGYAGYFTGRGYFSGNLGLGTLSPANRLSVAGGADISGQVSIGVTGADARLLVRGVSGEDAFRVRVEGGTKLLVKDNGGVGIGSNFGTVPTDGLRVLGNVGIGIDPTEKLHVSGNIRASGSVFASCGTLSCSDQRFKENVKPLADALDAVEKLRPVSFDWKREAYPDHQFSSQRQTGLIAQHIREVLPDLVQEDSEGYLSVDYARLTPLLVGAIQEIRQDYKRIQATRDRVLEDRDHAITALQAENAALAARLERLERLMAQTDHASEPRE